MASDIKLVFHSSTITMMHGPINIRFVYRHLVGLCKDGIGQSQDLYLHNTAQTRNTHTYIRISSGINTHDFKVRVTEDGMHLELLHVSRQPPSSFSVKILFTFLTSLAC